jgi:sugar lactone lactonase YvrE
MTITLSPRPQIVVDGLAISESPRWHKQEMYFSDVWAGRIHKVGLDGVVKLVAEFPGEHVSGLGFLPDGDLLAVLMDSRTLARISPNGSAVYADLSRLARSKINDMVVHGGRAYVSQFGFDIWATPIQYCTTDLLMVDAKGAASIAASEMHSPNGLAVSPDGATLFVAESGAMRILTFAIGSDGSLSDRRVFGQFQGGLPPDGICLDSDGGVWAAVPMDIQAADGYGPGVLRMIEGGTITHSLSVGEHRRVLACGFGGEDRRSLFLCTVDSIKPADALAAKVGRLERFEVDFQGAGTP